MKNNREYYASSYRAVRLIRYLILVIFVLFTVFSLVVYKNDITFDNFRYMMKYVELSPPGRSGGDGTFGFSADQNTNFALVGNKLALATKKEIVTYDMNGKKILDEDLAFQNPVAVENGDYMLIYEFGGYELMIFNSFSKVFEKKLDTPIDYAYISDDGGFALITCEKNYEGTVMAYDSDYRHIFTFSHPSSAVTDVCFDGGRGLLACATTDVQNGDFISEILVFDTKDRAALVKSSTYVTGELPLNMFCTNDGFAMMTDKGIHFYNDDCTLVSDFDFSYDTPCALYKSDSCFAVVLKSALADTDSKVTLLDNSGKVITSKNFTAEISHIDHFGNHCYILTPTELTVLEKNESGAFLPKTVIAQQGQYRKVFGISDTSYILVSDSGSDGKTFEQEITESTQTK